MDKTILLKPLYHRGQESIALDCDNFGSLNSIIKKIPQVKWSQTNKCWYTPLTAQSYNQIRNSLREKALLDNSELKEESNGNGSCFP
jgi:hypothetical protein